MVNRYQAPIVSLKDLPRVDVILISHDHYDHLDMQTAEFFKDQETVFITPLGVGSHLESWGIKKNKIIERDWHQTHNLKGIEFIATPSQHFSGRGLSDRNSTLWASWIIRSESHKVYFSGDSGYDIHFKEIGEKYGPFDIAFMENGQYNEKWHAAHLMPEEAAKAYLELKAEKVFPIHWGMFTLAMHTWWEPPQRLLAAVERKEDVVIPKIGLVYEVGNEPSIDPWWDHR